MKRDEMYYAREDVAFNSWVAPRKHHFPDTDEGRDAYHLARSAFVSGARFGSEEAEIQALPLEAKRD